MKLSEHRIPKSESIARSCPNCGKRMWLARIVPCKPDHDERTFECPQCDRSETLIVKYR